MSQAAFLPPARATRFIAERLGWPAPADVI